MTITLSPLDTFLCGIEWRNPSRQRHGSLVLPKKLIYFFWLFLQDKILTLDNLAKQGQPIPNRCSLCKHALETVNHLFTHCPYFANVQNLLTRDLGVSWCPSINIQDFFNQWRSSNNGLISQSIGSQSLLHFCWGIQKEQNNRIFRDRESHEFFIAKKIEGLMKENLTTTKEGNIEEGGNQRQRKMEIKDKSYHPLPIL